MRSAVNTRLMLIPHVNFRLRAAAILEAMPTLKKFSSKTDWFVPFNYNRSS